MENEESSWSEILCPRRYCRQSGGAAAVIFCVVMS